ncbi:imidazole glycerol phosphate synthase subunit HisH [Amphiplicatus metriothermophilus]|uniref:Imidazole glycerol phosphate synthase subunit HisH n=1 Tax=Amphiplicatus metriothermophilus TaxID=1519374 RepID=A0A239PK71_9PROT|nr:imidazole glycerol phosphate synthase subunit HisH [Amphiplicatus metriothermophilus]MBB5517629.1 glutamine amidotransferase [Amphiplicatus metriothermophilus]SNT68037.1 glutamine amidotransferase [Amphiplicatus metriothermophilus]
MTETVAVVDYGSGNLRSVEKSLQRAARESGRAARILVTADPEAVAEAGRVVLPGVGAFAACMDGLCAIDGMIPALEHAVLAEKRPFLGVCVGMQLLAEKGLEFGARGGLGWIPGVVRRLEPDDPACRVPHMGWNTVRARAPHPALKSLDHRPQDFYFVHSYHFACENDAHMLGVTEYGGRIAAIVGRDNLLGVQFHPEKSQAAGLALLADFLAWRP